ncbi:amidohydrolase [Thermodesulfobacteriota bacterium]
MPSDILIINGRLLTLAGGHTDILPHGYVRIKDGLITETGPMSLISDTPVAEIIDAAGMLVMPGLVNTHTHAAMTLFRGLADDLPLMVWLQEHIFPAEGKFVNPEMVYWCTKLAAAEMIMSGTTTVADGYFHEDSAMKAFIETGMRAVAAQGVIDFPAPGVPDPAENVRHAGKFIDRWSQVHPLITPALFCHSPYTCGPETLQKAKDMTRRKNARLFIHVAETAQETSQCLDQYGKTPVRHLHALGILDSRTICVHAVHLDQEELSILQQTDAKVSSCTESNMKLASGIPPVTDMLAQGISVGLGTDSCASNNNLDLFEEMDSCAKVQKARSLDPTALPARTVLNMATRQGADILGLGDSIGSLEAGKQADVIILDLNCPNLTPLYNADLLVYAAKGANVTTSIIGGKLVMKDRKIMTFDVDEVMHRVREMSRELLPGNGQGTNYAG